MCNLSYNAGGLVVRSGWRDSAREGVKDSKALFNGCLKYSIPWITTNHPSIAHRGVSCSKVGVGEPVPSRGPYYNYDLKS